MVLISSLGTCARERRRLAHERVLQRFIQEEEEAEGQAEAAAQLDAREAAEQAEAQRFFDGLAGESPAVGAAGAAGAAESSSGAGGGAGGGLAPIGSGAAAAVPPPTSAAVVTVRPLPSAADGVLRLWHFLVAFAPVLRLRRVPHWSDLHDALCLAAGRDPPPLALSTVAGPGGAEAGEPPVAESEVAVGTQRFFAKRKAAVPAAPPAAVGAASPRSGATLVEDSAGEAAEPAPAEEGGGRDTMSVDPTESSAPFVEAPTTDAVAIAAPQSGAGSEGGEVDGSEGSENDEIGPAGAPARAAALLSELGVALTAAALQDLRSSLHPDEALAADSALGQKVSP